MDSNINKKPKKSLFTILIISYVSHYIYYYSVFNKTYKDVTYLVIISLISLFLGYLIGLKFRIVSRKSLKIVILKNKLSYKNQMIIGYILICIGIFAHVLFYRKYRISNYAEGYGVSRGNGYITVFFNFWLVGMIILEYLSDNNLIGKKSKWINRILMVIYVFLYFFILTKRRQIIILFLSLLGIWKDKFTKKQKVLIYSSGLVLIFIFSIFGKVRGYIDVNGFSGVIRYTLNNFTLEWISLENFEGKFISRTLNDIYGYVQLYGHDQSILLGVLFCMIPRKLLGGTKPLSFPEWYTKHFHFDDFIRGTGYAGSFVAELYLIGGIILVIFGYLLIGYFCARIQKYRENTSSIKDTLVYSLFLYTIFILPRYDLSSLLMDAVFMYFPIILFCGENKTNSVIVDNS